MQKIRVFIIDDSVLVQKVLARGLSLDRSIEIVGVANNGKEAIELLQRAKADVVVTDVDMPVMNGLEFIERMMATRPLPIILLSAWTQNDRSITLQAMELGAVDFVPKPSALDPDGFQETLNRLLAKIKTAVNVPVSAVPKPYGLMMEQSLPKPQPMYAVTPTSVTVGTTPSVIKGMINGAWDFEKRSNQIILGIGEFAASKNPETLLKTFALGSCVAVHLFTQTLDIIGMVHIALPFSTISPDKATVLPGYFADTGLPVLIAEMRQLGYAKPSSLLRAKLTGGAAIVGGTKVGERNIDAVKQILQSFRITIDAEDTGGNASRTVAMKSGSHAVMVMLSDRTSSII